MPDSTEPREVAEMAKNTMPSASDEPEYDPNEATKSLRDLPVELLQAVAQEADRQDILALRLVCRDTSAKVDEVFIDTFFRRRRHLITRYSLDTLSSISKSTRLRAKLQEICLVAVRIRKFLVPGQRPPSKEEYEAVNPGKEYDSHVLCTQQEWDRLQDVRTRFEACSNQLAGGKDVTLLATALRELKAVGIIPKLTLDDDVYDSDRACGYRRLATDLGVSLDGDDHYSRDQLFIHPENRDSFKMLLDSISQARFPVKELSLIPSAGVGNLATFKLDRELVSKLQPIITSVQTLALRITDNNYADTLANEDKSNAQVFKSLFASCTSISKLLLWFRESDDGTFQHEIHREILETFADCPLQIIELVGGGCRQRDLTDFLHHHRSTLQKLSINGVELPSKAAWGATFNLLADTQTFNIEHCRIWNVQQQDQFLERGWDFRGHFTFSEKDVQGQVVAGLKWLAQYARYGEVGVELRTEDERLLGEEWDILWTALGVGEDSSDSEDEDDEDEDDETEGDSIET